MRAANQAASAKHKARGGLPAENAAVRNGSLVYIKSEKEKHKARDRFLVTDVTEDSCTVQKLTKSQLRAQKYQLKLSEVYPVHPDLIEQSGMIRDLDCGRDIEGEGDEAQVDPCVIDDRHACETHDSVEDPVVLPSVAEDVIEGCVEDSEEPERDFVDVAVEGDVVSVEESTPLPSVEKDLVVARPRRIRAKPKWMRSGEYVVEE